MENSDNISAPISSPEIRAFAGGFGEGPILSPSHVAWLLEKAAVDGGWKANADLGSEADLLARFDAGRDVVRGAIRIVEARGSMKMRRGCKGGVQLQIPGVDSAAVALAIYLQSHNYSMSQAEKAAALICTLLPQSSAGQVIHSVIENAMAILSDAATISKRSGNRAEYFAMHIIARNGGAMTDDGIWIGTETQLCEEFGLSHRTFRQALSILEDLEILKVRLGRGGGYFLKPASPMGVIRRIFVLLASRQVTIPEANSTLWKLGIARLRAVFDPQRGLNQNLRDEWAAKVHLTVLNLQEPRRWVWLQHAIDDLVDEPLTKLLTSAMVAYIARTELPPANHSMIDGDLRKAEHGLVEAIRCCDGAAAERCLLDGQALLDSIAS